MPPYSGFKPLVGGGAQHTAPPARATASTRTGLSATATVADQLPEKSNTPALRSTFVDKEEAAMLRAMARLNGEGPGKSVGNKYSKTNQVKLKARAEEAAAMGLVPLDPLEQHELAKKTAAGYTTISERAVRVPKVGQRVYGERPAPVECLPHRRSEEEIRYAHNNFERPMAPPGRPTQSSDARKDELALRNQFNGKTPQEILAEKRSSQPPPEAPPPPRSLKQQIEDEIAERHEFLDRMRGLGRAHEHEARITGEIAERMQDLRALARIADAEGEQYE